MLVEVDAALVAERALDVLALHLQLRLVPDVLPLAAAARLEVLAAGRDAERARLQNLQQPRLGERALALEHARADAVARHGAGDEDDVATVAVAHADEALAAVGEIGERELYFLAALERGGGEGGGVGHGRLGHRRPN